VFEEMGQAVLVVLLLQGAYVVGDEEIRPSLIDPRRPFFSVSCATFLYICETALHN